MEIVLFEAVIFFIGVVFGILFAAMFRANK